MTQAMCNPEQDWSTAWMEPVHKPFLRLPAATAVRNARTAPASKEHYALLLRPRLVHDNQYHKPVQYRRM